MKALLRRADLASTCARLCDRLPHTLDLDFYGARYRVASATAAPLDYLARVYHYFVASAVPGPPVRRLLLLEAGTEECERQLRPAGTVRGHLLLAEGFGWGIVLDTEALLRYYASKILRLSVVELLAGEMATLHAASLEGPGGRGVLLVGEAASGKTSTTLRLIERGFRYAADDTTCIRRRDRRCVPFPMPLMVRAPLGADRPRAAEMRDRPPDIQVVDEPRWFLERWEAVAAEFEPSHLLFFGKNGADAGASVELSPAHAALELLRNVVLPLGASPDAFDAGGRDFALATELAAGARCYHVCTRDLDRAFDHVLALVENV